MHQNDFQIVPCIAYASLVTKICGENLFFGVKMVFLHVSHPFKAVINFYNI